METEGARRRERADQSETAVVALGLRDPTVVDEALVLGLQEADFTAPHLRAMWEGMVLDRQKGIGPDEATVLERHESNVGRGRPFPDFGHLAATVTNLGRVPARRTNLETYVETLREFRARRMLLEAAQMSTSLHQGGADAARMQEEMEEAILRVSSRTSGEGLVLASTMVERATVRAGRIRRGEEVDHHLTTGLRALDRVLKYHPGHYGLIAARPGMGKTQLALTLGRGIAERHGPVLFVSVEMGGESLSERMYSSSLAPAGRIEAREAAAKESWDGVPMWMDYRAKSLSEVLSSIRIAKARHGIVAFVVDYLQKMRLPRRDSREQEIANASEALSSLCSSSGLCGLVLSQLNRGVDSRKDRRPMASDLRESGALEQDADSILFVYREVAYNRMAKEPSKVELILEKQRNGRAHVTVPARFSPGEGWFTDYTLPSGGAARTWMDD
jgi:replicative DNA helicase